MDNLERKLNEMKKECRDIDVCSKIMKAIESKDITMHSKAYFTSKKSLISFGFICLLAIIAFLVNLTLYDISQTHSLEYLDFGASGWAIMLQNLPYLLIISLIALFVATIWLMSRFEISYKKSFAIFIVVLIAGTSMGGTAIFASDFNDSVQERVDNERIKAPVVRPVITKIYTKYGPKMIKKNGLVGKITQPPAQGSNEFIITIPQGKQVQVKLMPNCKIVSTNKQLASGDLIIIMGKPIVDFHANGIKVIEDQKRALEMMHNLQARQFEMKFRQRTPFDENDIKQFQKIPINDEMRQEFMGNMGGFLQSEQDVRQANIIFEQ